MRPALLTLFSLIVFAPVAGADMLDDTGYRRLATELDARLPRGSGLRLLQVESALSVDHDRDATTAKVQTWMPDTTVGDLRGVTIIDRSGAPRDAFSRHATSVARLLAGRRRGTLPDLNAVEVYSVTDWMRSVLRVGGAVPPRALRPRVANHSWAASVERMRPGLDSAVLRRIDWLAERDEAITVAGVRNREDAINAPLLAAAYNVIVVGRNSGLHSRSTPDVDRLYEAGRARPHLVAPGGTASAATPVVAAAVLMLVETAQDPTLSTRSEPHRNRAGVKIYDAGRFATMRAVLMASASRTTRRQTHADIVDYLDDPAHRSANGLDTRYGAGQLDIYSAWHLLAGGERERSNDAMPATGFDYVAGFAAGRTASYGFDIDSPAVMRASLSWLLRFPSGGGADSGAWGAVRHDLDLSLYAMDGTDARLVAESAGRKDTNENLSARLQPGRYRLDVRFNGDSTLTQDYALAWKVGHDDRSD